jgi:hypothetical protein
LEDNFAFIFSVKCGMDLRNFWYPTTTLHGVTIQKTLTSNFTAVITSNLAPQFYISSPEQVDRSVLPIYITKKRNCDANFYDNPLASFAVLSMRSFTLPIPCTFIYFKDISLLWSVVLLMILSGHPPRSLRPRTATIIFLV